MGTEYAVWKVTPLKPGSITNFTRVHLGIKQNETKQKKLSPLSTSTSKPASLLLVLSPHLLPQVKLCFILENTFIVENVAQSHRKSF